MSYPKSVLRTAMERLNKTREENKLETLRIRNRLYEELPELKNLNKRISDAMLKVFDGVSAEEIKKELFEIDEERKNILKNAGYSENITEDRYSCSICRDEGFYKGNPCSCYLRLIKQEAYKLSNLDLKIEKENFDTYNENLFRDREMAVIQKNYAKRYCAFDKEIPLNLIFLGSTGTGKTFLSSCIAREFLDKGFSVLYVSATKISNILDDRKFGRGDSEFNEEYVDFINDCDLLIIDDLGTEYAFSYPQAQLFDILESRTVRKKRTVISTNLSTDEISKKYSPRFYSRIMQDYGILLFKGNDLRMEKLKQ